MSRTRLFLLLAALVLMAPACGDRVASTGENLHGHAPHGDAEDERPTVAVTRWTNRTELFMEYPVFVVGESGRSAIHVTDLLDFSPLDDGETIVVLRSAEGDVLEFRGGPSRPGIFGVDLAADRPGVYDMSLRVDAPGLRDLHELGPVTVHAAGEPVDVAEEEDGGIAFLKEQQWTLEFGTAPAAVRALRSSITVPAVIRPRAGGEAVIAAPVPGRIDPAASVPLPGARVREGEALVRIAPRSEGLRDAGTLRADLVEGEQAHVLATRERDRVARLVDARAVPARRLDEAEAALAVAAARHEAARHRWSRFETLSQSGGTGAGDGAFTVRAPFDGVVAEVRFSPGTSVEEDEVLLRLVDPDRVHVVGAVPESTPFDPGSVEAGEILRNGDPPIALDRPVSVGRVVEPVARTTEVRFAFENRSARLRIGESVRLRLLLGREESATAVPESSIVDDAGRPVVFVQTGGESFERRPVTLGSRAGGWAHVLEGIEPGERVVHRGAYLVRLAAMSTQIPAHGHVH